jgi:4-aminobutyrate aminotransferase / (S)-3-amino-2-methylpropionate transaminase / 5-aminovalerate transaminase
MRSKEEILRDDKDFVLHGWGVIPKVLVRGDKATVTDIDGNELIELWAQTAGVVSIGHRHPHWVQKITEQLNEISHTLTDFVNEPRATLARRIAEIAPGKMKNNCMMYFSCGGSEANEANLKAAMLLKNKTEVISTYWSYHGATLGLMSLLGQGYFRPKQLPRFPGFSSIPNAYCYRCYFGQTYPECSLECAQALEDHIHFNCNKGNALAFILELVPGNGGHQEPPKPYFKAIREICDRNDVLLIVDEVQTGVGRTGEWWASDYYDISPDLLTVGKAIGGGMPLSASVIRKDLVTDELINSQWHIVTFGGAPISCAAGNAVLDVIEQERLLDNVKKVAPVLRGRLDAMKEKYRIVGDVRGPGLFLGMELVKDRETKEPAIEESAAIFGQGLDRGIIMPANATGDYGNVLKFKPVLNITEEEIHKGCDILEQLISEQDAKLPRKAGTRPAER